MMYFFNKQSKEEKFWSWFVKNQQDYYTDDIEYIEKLFSKLSNQLQKVNSELAFEFSPIGINGLKELSISAEGLKEFFPVVINLIDYAPKILNWKFNAFRQKVEGDDYEININNINLKYSDIYFRHGSDNGKIGIELNIRNYDSQPQTQNAIYLLLDGLLGEYNVTMNIGWIDWVILDENNINRLRPFTDLRYLLDKE